MRVRRIADINHELTLAEHLAELRQRIIIPLISLILASAVSFSFSSPLLSFLKMPAAGVIEKLYFFSPQEAFAIHMRLAFLCGLVISMPIILCELWIFVCPAIEVKFRRYVTYFIFWGSFAFISGCAFAYFIIIPPALKFMLSFAGGELSPLISAGKYISFVTGLIMAGGIVFQMPLLSFILSRLGVINAVFLRKKYRYAIIVIFITAAIITPTPDAFNMLILAVPMLFLYEISIWVSFLAGAKLKAVKQPL